MSQFASTLHPQTNPSSQALLDFRDRLERFHQTVSDEARWWLAFGPPPWNGYGDREWHHAERVLKRLAALAG